jgi:hypothetical protein
MTGPKTKDHRLCPERLRQLFDYNPGTGDLVWRISQSSRSVVGAVAGTVNKHHGRRLVCVDGLQHYAHRVIWVHFYGVAPDGEQAAHEAYLDAKRKMHAGCTL